MERTEGNKEIEYLNKIKLLLSVLEFYANPETYSENGKGESIISGDKGFTAKETLKRMKDVDNYIIEMNNMSIKSVKSIINEDDSDFTDLDKLTEINNIIKKYNK